MGPCLTAAFLRARPQFVPHTEGELGLISSTTASEGSAGFVQYKGWSEGRSPDCSFLPSPSNICKAICAQISTPWPPCASLAAVVPWLGLGLEVGTLAVYPLVTPRNTHPRGMTCAGKDRPGGRPVWALEVPSGVLVGNYRLE